MQETTTRKIPLLGWFISAFLLVLLCKLYLASVLDLYSDEIFYWWASTRLSLAYSDLPFMTALLAGLGASLEPGSSIAVRSLFLLLGSSLPGLVYWVARPISNQRMALESAILTLCLPLAGFMGLLAVPDVPLIFFGLLSIGCFERALRTNSLNFWLATGIAVALGLCTHYRFFLYPLAAVLFLGLFKPERRQWHNPKLWLAMAIASLGLIPILWFNLSNQLSSASFYLVERHPWQFQASGLLHAFKQAGLVTPPLYGMFLLSLWQLYQQARQQDRNAALLLCFALTNLSVYLILAPWTDANSTSIHWPLSGYFPLLIALPATLRVAQQWCTQRWNQAVARRLVMSVPVLGFIGTMTALFGVGSQAYQTQLQAITGTGVLSNKMAGWREFTAHGASLLRNEFGNQETLIITDNYYTAAQAEFGELSEHTLTLDEDKAARDGRITQLQLWNKTRRGLGQYVGQPALYVNEDSTLTIDDKDHLMAYMCSHSTAISYLPKLSLYQGDKQLSFYKVQALKEAASGNNQPAFPCPYPTHVWIDSPAAGATLSGEATISGWAYNEDIGVATVNVLIDGIKASIAEYGSGRTDVVEIRGIRSDPNRPNLGYDAILDTTSFNNGRHRLAIEVINRSGARTLYGDREIIIAN